MNPLRSEDETREKRKMDKKNESFKPYISADKVLPEFTVTSILMGIILAVVFGAANDCICFHSGSSYFPGCDSCDHEKELHSGEQHGPDYRFSR